MDEIEKLPEGTKLRENALAVWNHYKDTFPPHVVKADYWSEEPKEGPPQTITFGWFSKLNDGRRYVVHLDLDSEEDNEDGVPSVIISLMGKGQSIGDEYTNDQIDLAIAEIDAFFTTHHVY